MTSGKRIRVLVVDDSAFMRKVLQSIIAADPQLEVCGEARDGRDAVTQADVLKPDVISMDINMPHMDGLQATEIIMSSNPRPILIVSSESREGADVTLKSLELGAIDFVPRRDRPGHELGERRAVPQAEDGGEGARSADGDAIEIAAGSGRFSAAG
jgi:two-component system chemotaxis response regulator CheB